ncbi:MAG: Pycsar system effector family protein [Lentimonas sp.]
MNIPEIDTQQPTQPKNWPALLRGSVLSSTQSKHVHYISLADRRAQVIITINAFLIPLTLSGYTMPEIRLGITLFTLAAALSIFFAIISLMPKRYKADASSGCNLLHFSGIWEYDEASYKELMRGALESRTTITELMVSDIYHLSNDVLRPKFRWIRLSFYAFLAGLSCALTFIVVPLVG